MKMVDLVLTDDAASKELLEETRSKLKRLSNCYYTFSLWNTSTPGLFDIHMVGAQCGHASGITLSEAYSIAETWASS